MPTVNRDDLLSTLMADNFWSLGLAGKVGQIGTTVVTIFAFILPQKLNEALTGRPRRNVGRLRTIVKDQIYQQTSFSGLTNCTIFRNKKGDGLLIYIPPRITKEFLADIKELGAKVRYIVAHNETHETYAGDAKKAFPDAEVLVPKASCELVKEAVQINGTLESKWELLESEYGFVKMFRFDENSRCTSERSFAVKLHDQKDGHCLFVAQCGVGNYSSFSLGNYLSGFQGMLTRGRFFRMYYNCFTTNRPAVNPYWKHMVNSVDSLQAAVFTHGDPILGEDTKERLLRFYVY